MLRVENFEIIFELQWIRDKFRKFKEISITFRITSRIVEFKVANEGKFT